MVWDLLYLECLQAEDTHVEMGIRQQDMYAWNLTHADLTHSFVHSLLASPASSLSWHDVFKSEHFQPHPTLPNRFNVSLVLILLHSLLLNQKVNRRLGHVLCLENNHLNGEQLGEQPSPSYFRQFLSSTS